MLKWDKKLFETLTHRLRGDTLNDNSGGELSGVKSRVLGTVTSGKQLQEVVVMDCDDSTEFKYELCFGGPERTIPANRPVNYIFQARARNVKYKPHPRDSSHALKFNRTIYCLRKLRIAFSSTFLVYQVTTPAIFYLCYCLSLYSVGFILSYSYSVGRLNLSQIKILI